MECRPVLVLKRAADGSVHLQYSNHSHYVPIPTHSQAHSHSHSHSHPHSYSHLHAHMGHSDFQPYNQHQSLTSYGAKPQAETPSSFSQMHVPMTHSFSASSLSHPAAPFSSSLPTSLSAPIPIRRHTLPHIAYPEYGREEYDDAHSYDGSVQSPASVQSPNERSFSEPEYEAPSSYSHNIASFRNTAAVVESSAPYHLHHSRGHAQEGSDGSTGWRTVAANVIDWSGRGGHARDSSSGSTASNMSTGTAIGEPQPTSMPYAVPVNRSHADYPLTPRSAVSGTYYEPNVYPHALNHVSPSSYYEAQSPNYVLSPSYQNRNSYGSPQGVSPVTLFSPQQIVPKSESLSPELSSISSIWQSRGDNNGLQEDDDKDSSIDDGDTKSASPDSSLPSTPAAVELALPPVVPSQPFPNDAGRVASISPPPHVDFDIQISSTGNVRMPRSCRSTVPVPIPNLTKKSRGRRVPTGPATAMPPTGVGKSARTFTCVVDGCGKCFNRGEHLKRHIRSIHTDEKPHVCPVAKCGKTFSRHDNLCQHMRVHGKFSAPADGGVSDY
ncbi:C2H2 zinc finger [Ceratobasidium sp. AG-Ba]|nr:C2H2 zinc finger [Ceratobasidium sp. AG-Ba]